MDEIIDSVPLLALNLSHKRCDFGIKSSTQKPVFTAISQQMPDLRQGMETTRI